MAFQALPGFRDFYPEEMALRRHVESAWHAAARAAGFEEVDGPPLESLELLKAKSGDAIVDELYAFLDKGGRDVALRAELTPTVARMIAARASSLKRPVKWYGVPQLFRYQRQQRGRLKEHIQWNVDVFGAAEIGADAEVLAVAIDALRRLGLENDDFKVHLSHRQPIEATLAHYATEQTTTEDYLRIVDKEGWGGLAKLGVPGIAWAGINERIEQACEDFRAACEDYGIWSFVEVDSRIVRGLAYYTGIVWEIFDTRWGERAVAGGGRYDTLVQRLGGPPMPGVGFGMGDVVLSELLKDLGTQWVPPARIDILVVPVGPDMLGPARQVVRRLRQKRVSDVTGTEFDVYSADENPQRPISAEAPFVAARADKAIQAAHQVGARCVVFVGPAEWSQGNVKVKNLPRREETLRAFNHL